MYKIFTLALAVSVLPVSNQYYSAGFITDNAVQKTAYIFPYKKNHSSNPFEATKKPTEAWSQNWMATAQENIRKSEYHFTWEKKLNAYCTPNRKNNLRFFYTKKGFTVEPRTTKIPIGEFAPMAMPDDIKYKTIPNWKVKFNLDKRQIGKGSWKVTENKAEYITDKVTVQYINNNEGMRQNFIVHAPLSKVGDLQINFSIKTKLKNKLSQNQLQFFHKKANVLNYKDLKVWDATGKTLSASFQKKKNKYFIHVDTKDAVYPITIDPISTTPSAILESNQASAQLGFSVASAGDVNGDGYSDVIAGALAYDNTQIDEGAAFIFHGSATGVNTTPAAIVESNVVGARLGISVSTAGDVNGDGYSDIIVGANTYSNTETWEGAIYIYHGSSTGINTTAAIMMESNQAQAQMGYSVACAGDVNSDGYSDVIVGAWLYDNLEANEGVAFVYHGSFSGITGTITTTLEANQPAANFGISVAGAGDVNGDGYSDVIVGAEDYDSGQTDEGVAFVYHGSGSGINNVAVTMVQSDQGLSQFGFSVASAGDVNGDGYSDVIVGAYTFDNVEINEGAAFIYHGSSVGINNIAADTLESNLVNVQFGVSVACAGDINGDGYSDIITGANLYDNVENNEGAAYIFFGSATGVNIIAVAILESNQANANLGRGVASAGDVNGDGYSDVIAGAPAYNNGMVGEGVAFVYHGSATGINTTAASMTESNQAGANMGISVATAGDVNSDGYSDLIVGALFFDNGLIDEGAAFVYHGSVTGINTTAAAMVESNQASAYMGIVAGAGDVNGDGFSDVIVGAFYYDNVEIDEGAAFVYHGTATGINTTAVAMVESNQVNAQMGVSVAGAGDVNSDGYSDVIVGAYNLFNGQLDEGAAFVYHGSLTGINTTATTMVESNQIGAYMGCSVAPAGDVNGDGYNDVIVGAYYYDSGEIDEGAAFVYHGSPTGINSTAAAMVECNQANVFMGYAVAGAGDVNGDGYSDVIVGAILYDNVQNDEGAAFVYHGNSPGINLRNNLRLYNVDLITPINNSNFIFGNFGAGLYAKSFLGRDSGKLVWETRLNYNAYSGTPITNSTFFTDQQTSYTDLGLTGIEVKNLITKLLGGRYTKLRARVKYNPLKAITGQVYSPWRNVSSILDANNLGALPIDLISFNAAWLQKGKTARLDFKTDKESGICCFDIEKSVDGFNFYSIGSLPAKNVSGIWSYSFIDNNAKNKNQFYRLKIKGIAGKIEYSNIQQLQNDKATEILVFPNPTTDVLQLQLNAAYEKMYVQIFSSSGQLVKQLTVQASNQTISIPVQNLATGKYWLHLQKGSEKQVLQFVKQ